MRITTEQISSTQRANGDVVSASGDRIGAIGQVYVDDETGEPTWVTAKTGLFGTSESFVPLAGANVDGVDVVVNYDRETVKAAPRIDSDGQLSPEEEETLYAHYGLASAHAVETNRTEEVHRTNKPLAGDVQPPTDALVSVTTATVENGRPRLRKYAVTENVTQSEPVRAEEVDAEPEPTTEAP